MVIFCSGLLSLLREMKKGTQACEADKGKIEEEVVFILNSDRRKHGTEKSCFMAEVRRAVISFISVVFESNSWVK